MKKKLIGMTLVFSAIAFVFALPGCGGEIDSDSDEISQAATTSPYQEVYDAGLIRYVGKSIVKPSSVSYLGDIATYKFPTSSSNRGPICMRGEDFFVEARNGSLFNRQLLIFLEGGGVCLDEICAATASPALSLKLFALGDLIGLGGILDNSDSKNPAQNYNMIHVPYCDGSIFMGDVDRVLSDGDDSNGTQDMAYQRGIQNITAALEVAKLRYPYPSRIVLAGTSGGSYGIVAATALVRYYYPNTEIVVVADSGAPMLRDNDKTFVARALSQINALQYVPLASCPDCIANGHVSKILHWALQRDSKIRIAYMSHADDGIIGDFFMQSPSPIFRNAVLRESAALAAAWPTRFHRFITPGTAHMYLVDIGVIPECIQNVVFYLFGPLLFTGPDVSPNDLAKWSMGALTEKGTTVKGKTVTGYQWLTKFLNNSYWDPCVDVVNY